MAERDLIKTGIQGLDQILLGGIPRGNLILVQGPPGTGKTTLGLEFIYRGITEFDEPSMIVLFEVSPDKLVRDAASFGWDLHSLEEQGRLKIVFTTRQVFAQEIQQADSLLLEEAAEIGARRIFVDGLRWSTFDNGRGEAFHVLAEGLQREGLTALLALDLSDTRQAASPQPEEFIADTILALGTDRMQRAVQRSIEVMKSRGQDFQMGGHSFRIVDGKGFEVYRRVQAPRGIEREHAAAYNPTTRIPTGIPGLDELVNGGYFVGSTTLVVGISGVGKSVMGLQYLAEGVRRGERGIMVSLDEPPAQIIRNASAVGIDLQAAIDSDLVRLWFEPPQEIEIDRHFAQIENIIRTFNPKRALIDSLSTYGSNIGHLGRDYRDFFHALVVLMKEYQVTAVYNHENPEMLGMSSMMGQSAVSSLVDNIILMNWVELGDSFRHGLTIAKMRANPTNRTTHECEVINGQGMRVLARPIAGALPLRPFASYMGLISRAPERHPPSEPAAAAVAPAGDENSGI
jgi:circadian clock protein KaiC